MKLRFVSEKNYVAEKNTVTKEHFISEFIGNKNLKLKDAWINIGGWQSWSPGYEVSPKERQLPLHCRLIKPFNRYLEFPGSTEKCDRNIVLGQFVSYLRWDDFYLCLASSGNVRGTVPPVQFIFNRKKNSLRFELCDIGKKWEKDEIQAEIEIFTADSYFELRDKLKLIFGSSGNKSEKCPGISEKNDGEWQNRFSQIDFLGKISAGWESWYNRYSFIDEKVILDDLNALSTTKNILNQGHFENIVFQIDDGWEKALGDWEINEQRFPNGLKSITEKIQEKGYVPGLWIAPFIIDYRSPIAKSHPEWILKDSHEKPIEAGFNFLWGDKFGKNQPGFPGSFYCLDLSIEETVDYMDAIMEKIIEEWGFRYIKLDFLYAGMINGARKNFGASYEHYVRALKKITSRRMNSKGQKIAYLGCGAPFELSFGSLPLCRIGCDTYEHWENWMPKFLHINGRNSAFLNITDTIGRAYWDKIIFSNDPDVIFIRKENCTLTENQKKLIGTVAAIFASQLMYSDAPATSNSQEEQKLAEQILDFFKKYENEEFGVKRTGKNIYEVFSKSKKYKGTINMEEGNANIQ